MGIAGLCSRPQRFDRSGVLEMVKIRALSLMKIDMEGTELRILQGAADHRSYLFYESCNYRAEISALFQDYGYLVFESDRHQAIVPETSSFISLPNDCTPAVTSTLAPLGYPIPSRRG
jgi:hypothetical protein